MTDKQPPGLSIVRTVLLAVAAIWLIGLVQRLAFGLALIAVGLIDWQRFRWWWLVIALLAVALVWTATGHPLLFGGFT